MKKIQSTLCLGLAIGGGSMHAAVGLDVAVSGLQTGAAGQSLESGSLFLVADTDNDSFGVGGLFGAINGFTNFLDGDDDLILWRSQLGHDFVGFGFAGASIFTTLGDHFGKSLDVGDALALVWFPDLADGDTNLTAGLSYGIFAGIAGVDGSEAWIAPADGSQYYGLYANGKSSLLGIEGDTPDAALVANRVVGGGAAPVPDSGATVGMLGLGALALAVRRRR